MKLNSKFESMIKIDWSVLWEKIPHKYYDPDARPTIFECDDAGGILRMLVGPDGDVHLCVDEHPRASECGHIGAPSIRVRTYAGGGNSQQVRTAMLLLMLAIIEDKESVDKTLNQI